MGVGAGRYTYVVVVKSSRSLSHLLMSSCSFFILLLGSVRQMIKLATRQLLGERKYSSSLIVFFHHNGSIHTT